ncbi:Phage integrase family protein [Candidatus Desulfosporosinus infrequens]|uniref:Phage integrase family protein n=1 Tax=Candidatus Desulfosporosinus infrequens TaxID=2043169 RepID=A0A2U3KHZ4_9FIRM|nr:Phage integrase family protein [Candidatus Desulfosporosinus infrequens]
MARLRRIDGKKFLTREECVKDFTLFKLAQGVSERTIKDYEWHLGHFFKEFPEGWGDYTTVKKAVIHYFANGNHLAPATHNMRRKYLKCFFSWMVQEGTLTSNPVDGIRQRREEPRVREIDEIKLKELIAIFDRKTYSGLRDYVLLCLTIDTGIRPKEALALLSEHFNLRGMEVHIPAAIAKTRISRTLPLLPLTVDGIRKLLSVRPESWGNAPLFASSEGKPIDTHAWTLRLRRYGEKLGFKISAYDLRHAFALMFLRNGGHALALQRTLGHTDLTVTKRYVALTQQDLREQHTAASPLNSIVQKQDRMRKLKN